MIMTVKEALEHLENSKEYSIYSENLEELFVSKETIIKIIAELQVDGMIDAMWHHIGKIFTVRG